MPAFHFAKFLTNAPQVWRIREDETVQLSVYVQSALTISTKIKIYNAAGSVLATDTIPSVLIDNYRLTAIINPSALSISVNLINKLEVWCEVINIGNISVGNRRTEIRTFYIDRTPISSDAKIIKWINRFGAEDYYTFSGNQSWQLSVTKVKAIREFALPWAVENVGTFNTGVFAEESAVVYSQFETRQVIKWLVEILSAQSVWIMETPLSGYEADNVDTTKKRIPVNVLTDNHAWQDQNELIQLELSFKYSNAINIQNG
jgi:hypothetical protein